MLSCRETTRLISESLERKPSLRQRMEVAVHLLMCRFCSRFRKQLFFMEKVIRSHIEDEREGEPPADREPTLSPEARQRMKRALRGEPR